MLVSDPLVYACVSLSFVRGVGAKLEVVRQNFSLLASFVITTRASQCVLQLPKAAHARGSGGMPLRKI